uniref:Putative transcriptional activator n=1 Tax=Streptomyces vietnamensis TaxID=362257 RepID=E3T4C0_9ACTN|nr:putative transcriptional activator [Streptomyces vietnamensis]
MTRMDSVRAATGSAKESVLHAAEVVAPYAGSARDQATHYAHEARAVLAPKVSKAASAARTQARAQYDSYVAPHVPPRVDAAAHRAAVKTRQAARQAADYTVPRVESAVAATGPVLEEAGSRPTAAWAALRGQVTPKEIRKIVKKHERRVRAGRLAKGLVVLGVLVGGAFAAWKWWDKQANPDWLVEPPAPTEKDEGSSPSSVDGSGASLDAEAETEADAAAAAEAAERDERR